jgi:hypothetical protein
MLVSFTYRGRRQPVMGGYVMKKWGTYLLVRLAGGGVRQFSLSKVKELIVGGKVVKTCLS